MRVNDYFKRLKILERAVMEKAIPSKDEFLNKWESMDELSKALYVAYAETPQLYEDSKDKHFVAYMDAVTGYLWDIGKAENLYSLPSIIKELENGRNV